jgi:iron complex outermembrane receptor protein
MRMKIVSFSPSLTVTVLEAVGNLSFQSARARIALACASAAIISSGAPTSAYAQSAKQNAASTIALEFPKDEDLQEIIVTGPRDPQATAGASLSLTSVVSASQLAATGAHDLLKTLFDLSPSKESPSVAPSYDNDKVIMRGLPPDNTPVMLNGIRRPTTATLSDDGGPEQGDALSDLGLFPSTAIDHIEFRTDGAFALVPWRHKV